MCCGHGPTLYGSCDPYAVLEVEGTRRLRTSVMPGETSPDWEERFEVFIADEAQTMRFVVKDADLVGAEHLGEATFDAEVLLDEQEHTIVLDLVDAQGNPTGLKLPGKESLKQARLFFQIKYTSVDTQMKEEKLANTRIGEVPRVYFPQRAGNKVSLYRDAHQTPGPVADIPLGDGSPFREASCWEDIYTAICEAKYFIFITGWSVWIETLLKRTPASSECTLPLGPLLLSKAEAGLQVLLLVWDDASNNLGLHPGLMATHDNETYKYFKKTAVKCVLCPRQGGSEDSILQSFTRNSFTHHQKTVVVDAPPPAMVPPRAHPDVATKRHVVAFVGGIDLCDGRYDTGDHPIFGTDGPGGPHENDHHQPNVEGWVPERRGPREPWHDIHARIEGPAAYDVMINFIERWSKQAGTRMQKELFWMDDNYNVHMPRALLEYGSKRRVLGRLMSVHLRTHSSQRPGVRSLFEVKMAVIKDHDEGFIVTDPAAPDSWAVQVFRSIDSDSATGFGAEREAFKDSIFDAGLAIKKGKVVDRSIHTAYIHAIRKAQRFIYIENQYFLGSSHLWSQERDAPCQHLVPAEIAFRICSKIQAGEPFRVYVVLPMWPEGVPTSSSVQDILHFQARTIEMMYRHISRAIMDKGIEAHPTDYLQFYCLGKRQPANCYTPLGCCEAQPYSPPPVQEVGRRITKADPATEGPKQAACKASRRFMIYVHSKMLIVDDSYAIIGSANINQRSMDGSRDTEIAVGLLQPGHVLPVAGPGPLPQGQISGFRRALFKEHVGSVLPEASDPSSLDCARRLRSIGEANWLAWSRDDAVVEMPSGHLMTYPIAVAPSGAIGPMPGAEEFPDLGGRVLGSKHPSLPTVLTT